MNVSYQRLELTVHGVRVEVEYVKEDGKHVYTFFYNKDDRWHEITHVFPIKLTKPEVYAFLQSIL